MNTESESRVALLLDTNILLWYVLEPDRLSSAALKILATDSERLYFSAAGALEIGIKYSIGRLALPSAPVEFIPRLLSEMNVVTLDVSTSHALAVGEVAATSPGSLRSGSRRPGPGRRSDSAYH